jgi:hypothetical protein
MGGQTNRATIAGSPVFETVQWVGRFQDIAFETLLSTLLTLPPTVRIEAMAATAINEAMSVYSIAVAPSAFFTRRRKIDSILYLQIPILRLDGDPAWGSIAVGPPHGRVVKKR